VEPGRTTDDGGTVAPDECSDGQMVQQLLLLCMLRDHLATSTRSGMLCTLGAAAKRMQPQSVVERR
jgi:hypothetical protein